VPEGASAAPRQKLEPFAWAFEAWRSCPPSHEPLIRHARTASSEVTSHEVLMPVVASLAVMLPAALAMMELESLRTGRHRSERVRRAIRRRALLLFTVSASVLAVVINVWPA